RDHPQEEHALESDETAQRLLQRLGCHFRAELGIQLPADRADVVWAGDVWAGAVWTRVVWTRGCGVRAGRTVTVAIARDAVGALVRVVHADGCEEVSGRGRRKELTQIDRGRGRQRTRRAQVAR